MEMEEANNWQLDFGLAVDHCLLLGLLCSECQALAWMLHDKGEIPESGDFCPSCQVPIEAQRAADNANRESELLTFEQWAQDRNIPYSTKALHEWRRTSMAELDPQDDPEYLLQELFEARGVQRDMEKLDVLEDQARTVIRELENVLSLPAFVKDVSLRQSCKKGLSNIQQLLPELTEARVRAKVKTIT